jgi:hypothetical protein
MAFCVPPHPRHARTIASLGDTLTLGFNPNGAFGYSGFTVALCTWGFTYQNGACVAARAPGAVCTQGTQCASGSCLGGR